MPKDKDSNEPGERKPEKPANTAPDAVKDPNEKTEGKPGIPPGAKGGESDPGGG